MLALNCGVDAANTGTAGAGKVGVSEIDVVRDYALTTVYTGANFDNTRCVDSEQGVLNKLEFKISENRIEVFATDAGSDDYVSLGEADIDLPFSRAYVHLSHVHYNAHKAYVSSFQSYQWARVAFDGPQLATPRSYPVPDSLTPIATGRRQRGRSTSATGVTDGVAYDFNDGPSVPKTLVIAGVDTSNALGARLLLNTSRVSAGDTLRYRFNGKAWHDYAVPTFGGTWERQGFVIPVELADLVPGDNTLELGTNSVPDTMPPGLDAGRQHRSRDRGSLTRSPRTTGAFMPHRPRFDRLASVTLAALVVAMALTPACADPAATEGSGAAGGAGGGAPGEIPLGFDEATWQTVLELAPPRLPPSPTDVSNRFGDDPAAAALGEKLFFDAGFSGKLLDIDNDGSKKTLGVRGQSGKVACAGCHMEGDSFTDTRSAFREISLGTGWTKRRTPSLLDVGQAKIVLWGGARSTLYGQFFGPVENPLEMNSSRLFVAQWIAAHYRVEYEAIFGAGALDARSRTRRAFPSSPPTPPAAGSPRRRITRARFRPIHSTSVTACPVTAPNTTEWSAPIRSW